MEQDMDYRPTWRMYGELLCPGFGYTVKIL
jgi:hypothetical protein